MKIDVVFAAKDVERERVEGRSVVVIDVLRATSVMITALAQGAAEIRVFERVEDTVEAGKKDDEGVLCGERKGLKIEGFHYGNSPLEYGREIEGKRMYMTTSNGTKALVRSESAEKILIGGFLNLDAVAAELLKDERDLVIVCAGTDGEYSLDDCLCAGMIIDGIAKRREVSLTDAALGLRALTLAGSDPYEVLRGSKHYSYLEKLGYEEDLEYCLQVNRYDLVPVYREGLVGVEERE